MSPLASAALFVALLLIAVTTVMDVIEDAANRWADR